MLCSHVIFTRLVIAHRNEMIVCYLLLLLLLFSLFFSNDIADDDGVVDKLLKVIANKSEEFYKRIKNSLSGCIQYKARITMLA